MNKKATTTMKKMDIFLLYNKHLPQQVYNNSNRSFMLSFPCSSIFLVQIIFFFSNDRVIWYFSLETLLIISSFFQPHLKIRLCATIRFQTCDVLPKHIPCCFTLTLEPKSSRQKSSNLFSSFVFLVRFGGKKRFIHQTLQALVHILHPV